MRISKQAVLACVVCVGLATAAAHGQLVPPASNDIRLQVTRQEIDEDAAGRSETAHVEAIGKQLQIDPRIVEGLRAGKLGWGEITIRLIVAREVQRTVPFNQTDLAQLAGRIGEMRKQKQSWEEITTLLHVDLASIVREAQRTRQELKAKAKPK